MKNYPGPLYAPWGAVVQGRGFDPVEERMKEQLNSLAESLGGKWYRTETLDSKGHRTERFIIERNITEEPDSNANAKLAASLQEGAETPPETTKTETIA